MTVNKRVAVIDCGTGNLKKLCQSLRLAGGDPYLVRKPDELDSEGLAVLPGVGAMPAMVRAMKAQDLFKPIQDIALRGTHRILAICVGMQLLADYGEEQGGCEGLGLVSGRVTAIKTGPNERLPHVGWNEIQPKKTLDVFRGFSSCEDVYFSHSYCFSCADEKHIAAWTPFGGGFASAVSSGNVTGVQFHPELSSRLGRVLLSNFLQCSGGNVA